MPRYYIHIDNHFGYMEDAEGSDVPNVTEAIRKAAQTVGSVLSEDLGRADPPFTMKLFVEDETHKRVATLDVTANIQMVDA